MSSGLHRDLQPSERHAPHSFEYANAAARTGASGFVSADVGKQALQTDDNSVWLLTAITPTWLQLTPGPIRTIKVGKLIPGNFTGNPKTATVTFTSPFPDTNYVPDAEAVTINGRRYKLDISAKVAGSFVIGLGSGNIADLVEVGWTAIDIGESP